MSRKTQPLRASPPAVSVTAQLAARFDVSFRLAQLAVSRGVYQRAVELAEASSDPRTAFIAAVNALIAPRRFPRFAPLESYLARGAGR